MTKPGEIGAPMTKPGDRIRLNSTSDTHTHLHAGDLGTVARIDGAGTVQVVWDSGSRLDLIPGEDHWTTIDQDPASYLG